MGAVESFRQDVENIMHGFFAVHGFVFETGEREERAFLTSIIYKSPKGRLKIYDDRRNGEVNCQIQVIKNFGENNTPQYSEWEIIWGICGEYEGKTIEELIAMIPDDFPSMEESLERIKNELEKNISKIWNKLAKL